MVQSEDERTQKDILDPKHLRENASEMTIEVTSKPASASTPSEEAQVSPTMSSPTGNDATVSTALTGTVSGESYTSSSHTSSAFSIVTTKASFFTSRSIATDTSAFSHRTSAEPSTTTSDATTSIVSTSAPLGETHTPSTTLSTTGMEASRRTASSSAPSERTDSPPPSTNATGSDVGTTLTTILPTSVETHSPTMVHNHSTHMSPTPAHVATRTTSGNTPSGETHTSLITLDSTRRDVTIDIALTTSLSPEIHTSSPRTLNDFVTSSMSTTSARQKTSSSDTDLSPSASPSTSASNVTSIPSTSAVSGEIHTSAKALTAITNHVNSDTPSPSPLTVETPIYSSPTITDVNKSTVFMTSSPGETQRSIANTGHTDNKGSTVMDPTDSPVNQTRSPTENGSTPGTHVTATPAPTKTLSKETTSPSTEANSTLTDVSHQTALTSLSEEAYTPTSSGTTPENETGTRTEVTSKPASASTPSEEAQVSPTMPSPTGNVVAVSTALTGAVSGESYTSSSHTSSTFSNVTTKASFFTSHSIATDTSASSHRTSAEPSTTTSDATTSIVSTSAPLGETHTPSTTLSTTGMEASRRTASSSAPSERTDSPPPSTNPTGSDVGTTLTTILPTSVETHSPATAHRHSTHTSPTPAHVATRTTSGNTPSGETHSSLTTFDSTGRDLTVDIALTTSLSPEMHTSSSDSTRILSDFSTSTTNATSARRETSSSDIELSPSAPSERTDIPPPSTNPTGSAPSAETPPTMLSPTGNDVAISTALTRTVSGESDTSSQADTTMNNSTENMPFTSTLSCKTLSSVTAHSLSENATDTTIDVISNPTSAGTPSPEAQGSPTMPSPTRNDVTVSTSLSGTLSLQSYTSTSYISIPFSNVTTSVTPTQEIPSPSAETSSPFTTKITIAESTSSASTTKTTTAKSTSSASTTKTTTAKSTIRTTTSELCHNGGTYDGIKCICNEDLFYGPKCEFRMDEIPINELSVTITVEAQVRITNREYKKSLEDLNSKYSQEIQAQFKNQMKDIYGAVPGYRGVEILRMRNGSIIVEHKVISQIEMKNNEEAIQQNLNAVTGAVNHSLAGIHTDGECVKDSDTCKNISDSKYADYYYPHMMEGTVRCISRCFNDTQDSMNCYNGVCRLSEIGPYCSCNKLDMFWYLDSYCQLPVQKTALGLGLALAVLFVVSITLTVFLIRAKRKKSKNSWSADADTWYGEDADEEWIPSGSLNIMNKTAVSSWDSKNSFCHEEDGTGGKTRQHRSFLSEGQDFGFQSLDQKYDEV
ncbi:hypothetical protein Chor_008943 [Crotalus horridus]